MRRIILAVCLVSASVFAAEKQTFESSETPATLLELFTSEGCSSCPPADAWMSRLKSSGDLWKNVVPVVFHVDYWDHLGWRDRFAKREFTARQQRYAAEWKSGSVYTPAFVANGREWRHWPDGGTVPINSSGKVGTLRVTIDESRKIAARFTPASQSNESLQLNVAVLASDLESNVARGENSGRKCITILSFSRSRMPACNIRTAATSPRLFCLTSSYRTNQLHWRPGSPVPKASHRFKPWAGG